MADHAHPHPSPAHNRNYGTLHVPGGGSTLHQTMHQTIVLAQTVNHGHEAQKNYEYLSAELVSDSGSLSGRIFRGRDRISRFLDHSAFGIGLDVAMVVIATVFVASYIENTYLPSVTLPWHLWVSEIVCASIMLVDYLFRGIYLSDHRWDYVFSVRGIVSVLVIVPVLPVSFFLQYHTLWYGANNWRFLYPFRIVKWYLEVEAVLNRCHSYMTPMSQFGVLSYTQILTVICVAAGIIQITETSDGAHNSTDDWTFFNSVFNSILVFVTIGTPPADNVLSKLFVGILVIVLVIIVPYQISKVVDISKQYTPYELTQFKPSGRVKHIVVCGDLTPSRIDHFFREIFHDDHDIVDINVVILADEEPSTTLVTLLRDPFFEKRTKFIQGTILDADDAERAACGKADAIFILARRCNQEDLMESDQRSLLRVMAARRFAPNAKIYVQMHLSSNRYLLENLNVSSALYFSEVMHCLLGQNCVCPGFSTFLYNLTTSSSDSFSNQDNWQSRYINGANHELYSVELPGASAIYGLTFAEVASLVYSQCAGVILFAVVGEPNHTAPVAAGQMLGGKRRILLNPGDSYTCQGSETAFVIAKDRREADAVTLLSKPKEGIFEEILGRQSLGENVATTSSTLLQTGTSEQVNNQGALQGLPSLQPRLAPQRSSGHYRRRSKLVDWQIDWQSDPTGNCTTKMRVENLVIESVAELNLSVAPIVVFILASTFPDHMEYFIGPLRVKAIKTHRAIIFVSSTLPETETFERMLHFRQVYFITGDVFHRSVHQRAAVETAHKVVIMSGEGEVTDSSTSELLADAPCIALHKAITTHLGPARAPRVITELINRTNVHFIAQNLLASGWFLNEVDEEMPMFANDSSLELARNFFMSPAFASGLTYSTSLCDSLMINQYFNSMIKNIMRELIFATWKDVDYLTAPAPFSPSSQSETAASPASSVVSSLFSPQHNGVKRSSLFAVETPLDFVGKTFSYVFHYLLSSDGIVTLGLYRCRPEATTRYAARIEQDDQLRSIPFGFVYVNPDPDDVLSGNDMLYVLSYKQPCWAT